MDRTIATITARPSTPAILAPLRARMVSTASMTRVASVTLLSLLLACGSTQKPPPGDGDGDGPDTPGPSGEDQAFNKYPAENIEGIVFVPQALGIPGMWNVSPAKKTTLAAARKLVAKPDASIVDLQVFAGLAWAESNKAGKKEA